MKTPEPKDAQPAFPIPPLGTGDSRDGMTSGHDGMQLRDYFAAKAMQSCIVDAWRNCPELAEMPYDGKLADAIAEDAYTLADAMMKARLK